MRDPIRGIDTSIVRDALAKAQTAWMSGATFISGGTGDVSFAKFREIPVTELIPRLQRVLAIRSEPDFPPEDYIGVSVVRPNFGRQNEIFIGDP